MSKTLVPWLAGAAAIALLAGGGAALAQNPQEAARQAAEDARSAAVKAREAGQAARDKAREALEASRDAREEARQAAHGARERAEEARRGAHEAAEHVRKEVRIYRGGDGHRDVFVFRSSDRAEHLRTILQLRPNQEAALTAYLEAVGKGGLRGDHMVRFGHRDGAGKTTAERLAEMETKMAEQQAAMKRRIDATKTFYGQLDDRQKKVFDSMPMLMFAGPGYGPMLLPVGHIPPVPPVPPVPPKAPML